MEKLILFGGAFDPIHNGHLRLAYAASMRMGAQVIFIPNRIPAWKKPIASDQQRWEMLSLALKENGSTGFSLSDYEYKSKDEVNYSIDTVRFFASKYANRRLYFLIGADQVNQFHKWKDAEKLAKLATPLYVHRNGYEIDMDNVRRFKMASLDYEKAGDVSSSDARELKSLDIPISVRDYIARNRLYYAGELAAMLDEKRYDHSVSVALTAYRIAKNSDGAANPDDAYIAGLLHDAGKKMDKSGQTKIMKEHFPQYLDMPFWAYHQFVGAKIAEECFHIENKEILDAISFHATGKKHMTPLGKIVYASDKIEPTRGYDSSKLIRKCLKNYYVGFVAVLEENRKFLKAKGVDMGENKLSRECMQMYLGVSKK